MSKILKNCGKESNKSVVKSQDWDSPFDRYGDDLTELILSYLPISDKIRLECTSKQVQSLIYNKQKCLRISGRPEESDNPLNQLLLSGSTNEDNRSTSYRPNDDRKQVNYRVFGAVLKKFKFLDTLRIEGNVIIDLDLIQTIADNCRPLKTLWIYDKSLTDGPKSDRFVKYITYECIISLAQKCGSSLKSLRINNLSEKKVKQLLYWLPELRSVTVYDIQSVISEEYFFEESIENSEELPKFLPKLKEIEFFNCNEKSLIQFQNEYSDNILKFSGELNSRNFKSDSMTQALAGIGRFRRLHLLDLSIYAQPFAIQLTYNGLKQLAAQSLQLKHLSFKSNVYSLENNLFSIFSSFKSLSSLKINDMWGTPFLYKDGSIRHLKPLTQLKHLSLSLKGLSDSDIENIDIYLPQLESLRIRTSKAITDKSLRFLSQMKYLSKLEINCLIRKEEQNITDSGLKQLIDGCPLIRSLTLSQENSDLDFDITEDSIEAMISRSKRIPKIELNFSFSVNNMEKSNQWKAYLKIKSLPKNFSIKISP